jgi:hypothetical protein
MDAGGVHQMTCAIYRTRQPHQALVALIGIIFSLQYIYALVATIDQNLFNFFLYIRGDGNGWQYMLFPFSEHKYYPILDKNMRLH